MELKPNENPFLKGQQKNIEVTPKTQEATNTPLENISTKDVEAPLKKRSKRSRKRVTRTYQKKPELAYTTRDGRKKDGWNRDQRDEALKQIHGHETATEHKREVRRKYYERSKMFDRSKQIDPVPEEIYNMSALDLLSNEARAQLEDNSDTEILKRDFQEQSEPITSEVNTLFETDSSNNPELRSASVLEQGITTQNRPTKRTFEPDVPLDKIPESREASENILDRVETITKPEPATPSPLVSTPELVQRQKLVENSNHVRNLIKRTKNILLELNRPFTELNTFLGTYKKYLTQKMTPSSIGESNVKKWAERQHQDLASTAEKVEKILKINKIDVDSPHLERATFSLVNKKDDLMAINEFQNALTPVTAASLKTGQPALTSMSKLIISESQNVPRLIKTSAQGPLTPLHNHPELAGELEKNKRILENNIFLSFADVVNTAIELKLPLTSLSDLRKAVKETADYRDFPQNRIAINSLIRKYEQSPKYRDRISFPELRNRDNQLILPKVSLQVGDTIKDSGISFLVSGIIDQNNRIKILLKPNMINHVKEIRRYKSNNTVVRHEDTIGLDIKALPEVHNLLAASMNPETQTRSDTPQEITINPSKVQGPIRSLVQLLKQKRQTLLIPYQK